MFIEKDTVQIVLVFREKDTVQLVLAFRAKDTVQSVLVFREKDTVCITDPCVQEEGYHSAFLCS